MKKLSPKNAKKKQEKCKKKAWGLELFSSFFRAFFAHFFLPTSRKKMQEKCKKISRKNEKLFQEIFSWISWNLGNENHEILEMPEKLFSENAISKFMKYSNKYVRIIPHIIHEIFEQICPNNSNKYVRIIPPFILEMGLILSPKWAPNVSWNYLHSHC